MTLPIHEIAVGDLELSRKTLSLDDLVYELKREVRRAFAEGRRGVAVELIARYPELRRRIHVFEVLYEEYQLLVTADEEVDLGAFAGEFTWFPDELGKNFAVEMGKRLLIDDGFFERFTMLWPKPGDVLGGFEIVSLLGAGSAAHVYLAKEPALGDRLVAIKASPRRTSEAETLGKLLHPNIVPVHSVTCDVQTGLTLVCMPFLSRATLHDVFRKLFGGQGGQGAIQKADGPLENCPTAPSRRGQAILDAIGRVNEAGGGGEPASATDLIIAKRTYVDSVVHLAAQIADALAYTHAKDICHGDLKPANVLMTPGGRPMLLDFNLANPTNSVDSEVGGTLVYMPPERLLAAATECEMSSDPRSDLYSLGAIVYQLLCGELPFGILPDGPQNRAMAKWMWERQATRPLPLGVRNGNIDPSLARLVDRCLAFDAADRPQTARELASELRRCLVQSRRVKRWVRSHRWLVTAAAAAMIFVLGAAAHRVVNAPTPAEYAFDQGKAAYQHGDYAGANQRFTESLDYGGKWWQTWYLRGLARQHLRDYGAALDDYQAAMQLHPTPIIKARIADCFCRPPKYDVESATGFFRAAIEQGVERPEVYNNLGVCFQLKSDFKDARDRFDLAIALSPDSATIYYNRAVLEWTLAFSEQRVVSKQALQDIEQALLLGEPSADVLVYAARMYSYRTDDAMLHHKALAHLAQAIENGAKIELLNQDPILGALMGELRNRADYPDLIAAGAECKVVPTSPLLDLPDDPDLAELASH